MPRALFERMLIRMEELGEDSPSRYVQYLLHNDTVKRSPLRERARYEDDVSPRGYGQKNVVEMPAPKTHKVSYAVKLSQKKKRQAARKKSHAA